MFLRSNMDSQGFVPLSLIAGFNRVSTLLQTAHEPVQYVRQACMASRDVEFVVGDDTVERLRTLNNPRHWVFPMEDRAESARNAGPASFFSRDSSILLTRGWSTADFLPVLQVR